MEEADGSFQLSAALTEIPILRIDIVSDVVCPWCIIGYKRLAWALDRLSDRIRPALRWHPFELNPHLGPEGHNLRELLAQKYGTTPGAQDGETFLRLITKLLERAA